MRLIQKVAVDRSLCVELSHCFSDSMSFLHYVNRAVFQDRGQPGLADHLERGGSEMLELGMLRTEQKQRFPALRLALVEF